MNMTPEKSSLIAFGRHVVSYAAGAVTVAASLHAITPEQSHDLTNAINQIVSGVTTLAGGITTLASFGAALYAGWSATRNSQIKAVAANPDVTKIVTTPQIAGSIPSEKVVS